MVAATKFRSSTLSMAFLHKLLKCRRSAVIGVASTCFWALVLVLLAFLAKQPRHVGVFGFGAVKAIATSPPSSELGRRRHDHRCQDLESLPDNGARCRYVRTHPPCAPQGYVDYLRLYYCDLGRLGGAALLLWLLVLFYLLGDTASQYFCASLEGLSAALRLPPAIAGITFLALGNGAPDVLSSVVAFADAVDGEDAPDIGLSGALGGALFVTTVVTGVVALVAKSRDTVVVERRAFVRDACFLLVALSYLLALLLAGTFTVWAAAAFLSLYAAYVLVVWIPFCCAAAEPDSKPAAAPELAAPLLVVDDDAFPPLPVSRKPAEEPTRTFPRRLLDVLHSPLYLPRRLTIPVIAADRWSKPYAVASALLAPLLLAATYSPGSPAVVISGASAGAILASAAAIATDASAPPRNMWIRLPWLGGGFLMSVLWTYMLARELVALLVSIGYVAGVSPSLLGATVLAWGNSLGDLVANVSIVLQGGPAGVQTAVSGCYGGPAFNMVVGLGLSLTLVTGTRYPEPYSIPVDASAYEAVGFLVAALVWTMMVLLMRRMRMSRALGAGLLLIYLCFLSVRICDTIGILSLRAQRRDIT